MLLCALPLLKVFTAFAVLTLEGIFYLTEAIQVFVDLNCYDFKDKPFYFFLQLTLKLDGLEDKPGPNGVGVCHELSDRCGLVVECRPVGCDSESE